MTAEIITLDSIRDQNIDFNDITDVLKRVHRIKREVHETDGLMVVNAVDLKKIFEVRLNNFFLDHDMIGLNFFSCSMFVASLLTEVALRPPKSWYATDYVIEYEQKSNPREILTGANVCFVLSSLYKERCERRTMSRQTYIDIGSGLYGRFYNLTQKEVTYNMSKSFELLSDVTHQCLANMRAR